MQWAILSQSLHSGDMHSWFPHCPILQSKDSRLSGGVKIWTLVSQAPLPVSTPFSPTLSGLLIMVIKEAP